jgi:excisionase family DNA binding protein
MEDKFFTIEDVARYLKIPKSTLYKLSQKGRIPSVKIGKQLRFRKSSLDNWLNKEEHQSTRAPEHQDSEPANSLTRKPGNILLIDDDTLVLKAVSKLLQLHGYSVTAAESGQSALEKIKDAVFNLVITDIRMPGLDGIETIKRIREFNMDSNRPQAPEIIITGYTDPAVELKAAELGITDYVYKPFLNSEFMDIVNRKAQTITSSN